MNREIEKYIEQQITHVMRQKMDECLQRAIKKIPVLQEILEADTFYPNIPEADHSPSADQPLMKLNNQKITKQWSANHTGITDTQNIGLHTRLDLKNYTTTEKPINGFGLIYFLNNALKIFNPQGKEIKIQAEASMGSGGFIRIPAGTQSVLIQCGRDGGGNGKVVGFPQPFSQTPVVVLIPRRSNPKAMWVRDGSENNTQFTVGMDGGVSNFNWIAVGT